MAATVALNHLKLFFRQAVLSPRRLLGEDDVAAPAPAAENKAALPGGTFTPAGGRGTGAAGSGSARSCCHLRWPVLQPSYRPQFFCVSLEIPNKLRLPCTTTSCCCHPAKSAATRAAFAPACWCRPWPTFSYAAVTCARAGSWEPGGSTGCIMIHANLMKDGRVIGWGVSALPDQCRRMLLLLTPHHCHDCSRAF